MTLWALTAEKVCLRDGCERLRHHGGHGEETARDRRVSGGTCVMCAVCCETERRALLGSDLERALNAILAEGNAVDAETVQARLTDGGFVRPGVPDARVEATCRVLAERINLVVSGRYRGPPRPPAGVEYRSFKSAFLGDTFHSEPWTPCENCGRLFVWWPPRPRRCQRDACRRNP